MARQFRRSRPPALKTISEGAAAGIAKRVYVCGPCGGWHDRKVNICALCGAAEIIIFASKVEARYHAQLRLLEAAGKIRKLLIQPKFDLHVINQGGMRRKIGIARLDFAYEVPGPNGRWFWRYIEVKGGTDTALSRWKRRHIIAQYGISIEVSTHG